MNLLVQELRSAIRAIRSNPQYVLISVLTLGIGIGMNAMVYSIVSDVLLRPIPMAETDGVVVIRDVWTAGGREGLASYPDVANWTERSTTLAAVGAYRDRGVVFTAPGRDPEEVAAEAVSANVFSILRVRPERGRLFLPGEDRPGAARVVLLSHQFWTSRLGGKPAIVGSVVTINRQPHTVIGVMPRGFGFPDNQLIWVPLEPPAVPQSRDVRNLRVVARLAPGATPASAQREMTAIAARLVEEYPATNASHTARVLAYKDALPDPVRIGLLAMLGAVGFVLLVACANVASLSMSRSLARQRDVAVRVALGASRSHLARLLLVECLLIGLIGGAVAIPIAYGALKLFRSLLPFDPPLALTLGINVPVLLYTLFVSLVAGALFGLAPLSLLRYHGLGQLLREGGRGVVRNSRRNWGGDALVVGQIAASLLLQIGALLMIRSFLQLQHVDPGFDPRGLLTAQVSASGGRYDTPEARLRLFRQVVAGAKAIPLTSGAASTTGSPVRGQSASLTISAEGAPPRAGDGPMVEYRGVSEDYFQVLGIPIERGRSFTPAELGGATPVVVVSRAVAELLWPGQDPVERRLLLGDVPYRVVGVVPNPPRASAGDPLVRQVFAPFTGSDARKLTVLVRTKDPAATARALRTLVTGIDPGVPVSEVMGMEQMLTEANWQQRLFAALFTLFAGIAVLLAVIGVYGVTSYRVSLRKHEVAVRLALGARAESVVWLLTRQGVVLAGVGVVIGVLGALALTRAIRSILYGVGAVDPPAFLGGILAVGGAAMLATFIPARRAAKADPVQSLASK